MVARLTAQSSLAAAIAEVASRDPVLADLVARVGPIRHRPRDPDGPFSAVHPCDGIPIASFSAPTAPAYVASDTRVTFAPPYSFSDVSITRSSPFSWLPPPPRMMLFRSRC